MSIFLKIGSIQQLQIQLEEVEVGQSAQLHQHNKREPFNGSWERVIEPYIEDLLANNPLTAGKRDNGGLLNLYSLPFNS